MSDERLPYHRKYRPSTLSGYIGNDKLKETALKSLANKVKPQVILLHGASGCGKTSFARLLAKEYLCTDRDTTSGACGTCISCEALEEYILTGATDNLSNVKEIDIASDSTKSDLEVVLEDMFVPAYGDDWKVYIFDECHMADKSAQNRFLKVAEEPPENVLIIFCTTDPEMMLDTLKNRCQLTLNVKKPVITDLTKLLSRVCKAEGVEYDNKGVIFIANRCNLTIRNSLTSLERVIVERGDCKYDSVVDVFEEVSDTLLINFYKKLLGDSTGKRDVMGYIKLLYQIKSKFDMKVFIDNLINFTMRGIYAINHVTLEGVSDGELLTYTQLFGTFSMEQLAVLLDKLLNLKGDIETNLMLMGYTGILGTCSPSVSTPGVYGSGLGDMDGDVADEHRAEANNRTLAREEIINNNVANLSSLSDNASLADLESLFGGIAITE